MRGGQFSGSIPFLESMGPAVFGGYINGIQEPLERERTEHEANDVIEDTGIQRRELFSSPVLPHPYLYFHYVTISGYRT